MNTNFLQDHKQKIFTAIRNKDLEDLKSLMSGNQYTESFLKNPFLSACATGDVAIISYLMTSTDFIPNPCSVRGLEQIFAMKHESAIHWLIFDYNMQKSAPVEEVLIEMTDKQYAQHIESLFEKRKLNKELNKKINENSESQSNIKQKI